MPPETAGQRTSLWLDRDTEPLRDILPADGRFDDVVVGGGLTGLVTALLLGRAGRRVGVVEARQVGAVTTGHTTAKVTLLQGTKLSRILSRQSRDVAAAYLDANREGMEWLLRLCDDHGVPVERRDAVTYAAAPSEVSAASDEHEAARSLGLETQWHASLAAPFPVHGATLLPDQAQLHPMELVDALVEQLRLHGGTVHEGNRVVGLSRTGSPRVELSGGETLEADTVVLATGTPIVYRGLYFAKVEPKRSYLLAYSGFEGESRMYLSTGESTRSVRDARGGRLLVGGSGHTVGRTRSERAHLDELRSWTAQYFPELSETHAWSAQDYAPYDEVPIVGQLPLSSGRVFVATGFDKWGMTNAVAAAHSIVADILGSKAPRVNANPFSPAALVNVTRLNTAVGLQIIKGLRGEEPRCTHLGGRLRWNDAEESWDCPLHGSRFTPDGSVLEGPATRPLR